MRNIEFVATSNHIEEVGCLDLDLQIIYGQTLMTSYGVVGTTTTFKSCCKLI